MHVTTWICVCLLITVVSGSWIQNPNFRKTAEAKTSALPKEFSINLDLPADQRWAEVGAAYKNKSWQLVNYLRENLPKGLLKPMEAVAKRLMPFFKDYGAEMQGYATALGVSEGDVVMFNLVYQMEHLGVTCDNWNSTGPVDPKLCIRDKKTDRYSTSLHIHQENEEEEPQDYEHDGPGACTSFVASNPAGKIIHGRNLDWNLEDVLKQFVITAHFTRGGQPLFTATTMVGFVGVLHAVKPNAFGWSMDARRKGGSIPLNLLEAILHKGVRTPEQQARWTFENANNYDDAVKMLSESEIVNDAYFIVSGTKYPEGTVLARRREAVAHRWNMGDQIAGQGPFFVAITNYDLTMPQPPSDQRLVPVTANLNALAGKAFDDSDIWTVLQTWPTMNQHTDITAVMDIQQGSFNCVVWFDNAPPSN